MERFNGQPAGNGWTSPANNGAFGTDYIHRAGAVKADPYDNKRSETMYFYIDDNSQSDQLGDCVQTRFRKGVLEAPSTARRRSRPGTSLRLPVDHLHGVTGKVDEHPLARGVNLPQVGLRRPTHSW